MDMNYTKFLERKSIVDMPTGIEISQDKINPMLFDFQQDIVKWALIPNRR